MSDTITVLVVEDDTLQRVAMAEQLRDSGFRILEAMSAREALILLEDAQIDAVVSDIHMPGPLDGSDLVRHITAERPDIKVVVVSGSCQRGDACIA